MSDNPEMRLPKGFTVYSSRLSSEHARELGWGINEEERTRRPAQSHDDDGRKGIDLPKPVEATVDKGSAKTAVKPRSPSATSARRAAS